MIINLDVNRGDWFTFCESRINEKGEVIFDDPKPDAGRVCIRSIAPILEEIQAGKKRKYEFILNSSTRSMERVGYFEEDTPETRKKEWGDVWDYAITDIENFFDQAGNPIECTRENKIKLMKVPVFDRFVARCLQVIAGAGVKIAEASEKN